MDLAKMTEEVEALKKAYAPYSPIRLEIASDLWKELTVDIPEAPKKLESRLGCHWFVGIPIFQSPFLGPGEWAPVFRSSK